MKRSQQAHSLPVETQLSKIAFSRCLRTVEWTRMTLIELSDVVLPPKCIWPILKSGWAHKGPNGINWLTDESASVYSFGAPFTGMTWYWGKMLCLAFLWQFVTRRCASVIAWRRLDDSICHLAPKIPWDILFMSQNQHFSCHRSRGSVSGLCLTVAVIA